MANPWLSDLKIAESFVRSIDTDDHELNYELQVLADRLHGLIDETSPGVRAPDSKKGSVGNADR